MSEYRYSSRADCVAEGQHGRGYTTEGVCNACGFPRAPVNLARYYTGTYEQYLAAQKGYGFYPISREAFESWQSLDRERYGHLDSKGESHE